MTTFERVRNVLVEQLDLEPNQVTPQFPIAEQMAVDSLDLVEILLCFEEEFGISLSDEEARQMDTVQDMANLINQRLAEGQHQ